MVRRTSPVWATLHLTRSNDELSVLLKFSWCALNQLDHTHESSPTSSPEQPCHPDVGRSAWSGHCTLLKMVLDIVPNACSEKFAISRSSD